MCHDIEVLKIHSDTFGKNCDGINIDIKTDDDGGTSTCYICDDPAMFSDSSYEGYTNVGLLPRSMVI